MNNAADRSTATDTALEQTQQVRASSYRRLAGMSVALDVLALMSFFRAAMPFAAALLFAMLAVAILGVCREFHRSGRTTTASTLLTANGLAAIVACFLNTVPKSGDRGSLVPAGAALIGLAAVAAICFLHGRFIGNADVLESGSDSEHGYADLRASVNQLEARNASMNQQAEQMAAMNTKLRDMQASLEASYQHMAQMNRRLEEQATTDSMTGLANHRSFQERLKAELAQSFRTQQPIALLMLDVDSFKAYNDAYGHPAGDEVLKEVGSLIRSGTRIGDVVARYGGEEFAVILPATDIYTAKSVAERIRTLVEAHPFPERGITVSIGVAAVSEEDQSVESIVQETDEALYLAKAQGRNRVCVSDARTNPEIDAEARKHAFDILNFPSPTILSSAEGLEPVASDKFGGLEGLLQESTGPILTAILGALDLRDHESPGHPQRVARYALHLAAAVAGVYERRRENEPLVPWVTPSDVRDIAIGSLLHDIGNIRIPDYILRKVGGLSPEELALLKRHPRLGAEIVGNFSLIEHALPVINYHHERWDGLGYPFGLAGEDIPLSARVFAVCDALDSMTTDQPYRKRLSFTAARDEIRLNSGKQFDPTVVEAFLQVDESDWEHLQCSEDEAAWIAKAA